MNTARLTLAGTELVPLPAGALWWPERRLLAFADLHLGKSERLARNGATLLPPYETEDTLKRLASVIDETRPETVVSLGDCFDDMAAADAVVEAVVEQIHTLAAGRQWIWIAGNHDPGPIDLPGSNVGNYRAGPLVFRHIGTPGSTGEVSGHFHPKMRIWLGGSHISRPCFLSDSSRVVLPAFGTYTGGLDVTSPAFDTLFSEDARAWLTGRRITPLPRYADALVHASAGRR